MCSLYLNPLLPPVARNLYLKSPNIDVMDYPQVFCLFRALAPTIRKTTPFQNPRSEPIEPTASKSGYDSKWGLMKAPTRFAVGATHTARSTTKNMRGMSMYCLNDTGDRFGVAWVAAVLWEGPNCDSYFDDEADSSSISARSLAIWTVVGIPWFKLPEVPLRPDAAVSKLR